ncbi:thioredoxin-like protein [Trichoderma evansii]
MSAAASPYISLPPQQQQRQQTHHFHITDDSRQHHHHRHHHHHERQPLPSASRKPTAAALRREKMAAGLATSRGAGGLIRLEIYMDLLCPWCFIEKHSLEALMQRYREEHPEVRFEAMFRPYYIAPTMAKHGVEKRGIYDRLESLNPNFLSRIQVAGAKHDIAFSIRGVTGNTRTAHRLSAVALRELGPAGQSGVVEQLFQGHFEDGRDLSDEAWLVTVGVAAGIPEAVVRAGLEDEEAGRRVDAVAQAARDAMGVEAVPCVMVQDRYKVGGYQESHVFESLFEKIRLAGEGL